MAPGGLALPGPAVAAPGRVRDLAGHLPGVPLVAALGRPGREQPSSLSRTTCGRSGTTASGPRSRNNVIWSLAALIPPRDRPCLAIPCSDAGRSDAPCSGSCSSCRRWSPPPSWPSSGAGSTPRRGRPMPDLGPGLRVRAAVARRRRSRAGRGLHRLCVGDVRLQHAHLRDRHPGLDESLFDAAKIDGATSARRSATS